MSEYVSVISYGDEEINPEKLAKSLYELTQDHRELLEQRGLHGLIARYADTETAVESVKRGAKQTLDRDIGHYAIVGSNDDVEGSASLFPNLPLKRLRLPLPPVGILGRRPIAKDLTSKEMASIAAWGVEPSTVTQGLLQLKRIGREWGFSRFATVEPLSSPVPVHRAITAAGLSEVSTGRIYDGETRLRIPPKSIVYGTLDINPRSRAAREAVLKGEYSEGIRSETYWRTGKGEPPIKSSRHFLRNNT